MKKFLLGLVFVFVVFDSSLIAMQKREKKSGVRRERVSAQIEEGTEVNSISPIVALLSISSRGSLAAGRMPLPPESEEYICQCEQVLRQCRLDLERDIYKHIKKLLLTLEKASLETEGWMGAL